MYVKANAIQTNAGIYHEDAIIPISKRQIIEGNQKACLSKVLTQN